jgi:hypothetical protein
VDWGILFRGDSLFHFRPFDAVRPAIKTARSIRRQAMCGLCGLLGTDSDWSTSIATALPTRQQRFLRIALANKVLSFFRLKLEDFQGVAYILTSPTGHREIITDFGQIWRVAESLSGRPIDPLDPALLAWLSSAPQ